MWRSEGVIYNGKFIIECSIHHYCLHDVTSSTSSLAPAILAGTTRDFGQFTLILKDWDTSEDQQAGRKVHSHGSEKAAASAKGERTVQANPGELQDAWPTVGVRLHKNKPYYLP